jgi:uncharacterized membrane protein YgcG
MRLCHSVARVLVVFIVALLTALLASPAALAEPPFRVQYHVTDRAGALSASQQSAVQTAVDQLFRDRRIKLWVVYVKSFDGMGWMAWSQQMEKVNDLGTDDVLLAIATDDRSFAFNVNPEVIGGSSTLADNVRRERIEPALRNSDWAGAAIGAATGLSSAQQLGPKAHTLGLWVVLGVLALLALPLLWWIHRQRKRRRHDAEVAAAKRIDPTDVNALATVPLEALDELSKQIVVDVDNAVRTSENELQLAAEEFGATRTEPFKRALGNAKAALAQAFTVRQTLDDDVPETPLQRRQLLTQVITSAAKADRELEAQQGAFEALRNLVINAPDRLDSMTQQMVALTARLEPAQQTLTGLHQQFSDSALASVAGNVDEAKQRLTFADENIGKARGLVSAPSSDQTALIDTIRSAESALQQSQTLLDGIDSAATDINRAIAGLPAAVADIQNGIDAAATQLQQANTPQADALASTRQAAVQAVEDAEANKETDPLGTFTRLTKADADLDRLLEEVAQQRAEGQKQAQVLDQALFAAQSRVKAVSEFIDTRRGSIGPEARTRLAEAARKLEEAQAEKTSSPAEAIAQANSAATLAAQAQALANDDVSSAQVSYAPQYSRQSDMGSVLGGIIIGNILRGGMGGWGGGDGGRSAGRPTTYGGSSQSSGRSYSGGRF